MECAPLKAAEECQQRTEKLCHGSLGRWRSPHGSSSCVLLRRAHASWQPLLTPRRVGALTVLSILSRCLQKGKHRCWPAAVASSAAASIADIRTSRGCYFNACPGSLQRAHRLRRVGQVNTNCRTQRVWSHFVVTETPAVISHCRFCITACALKISNKHYLCRNLFVRRSRKAANTNLCIRGRRGHK